MTLIDNLTNFARQQTTLLLDSGETATITVRFCGATERWLLDFSYGGVDHNGIGLCCHPNILRQWRSVIPFGIACATPDQTDPFDINDFYTGRVQLFLLNASDVLDVERQIFGAP